MCLVHTLRKILTYTQYFPYICFHPYTRSIDILPKVENTCVASKTRLKDGVYQNMSKK